MARADLRLPANVPGDLYVDSTCIDCATCRQVQPAVFAQGEGHSFVEASRSFPEPVGDGVSFCGYTSERSFGAWSWLIRREAGNVLVDSPRAAAPQLEKCVAWMKTR